MSNESLELKYHDITELYELADQLVDTVESEFVARPEAQLALIEPLVEAVGDAADMLTEEFLACANQPKSANKPRAKKIEGALRKIYMAIEAYKQTVSGKTASSRQSLLNIADPIVEKIKRQAEVIIAVFVDFLDLSLDKIMMRTHVEEIKQRQQKIALMLHEAAQGRSADSY